LVLPKFSKQMWDLSFANERYDGSWIADGSWVEEPNGNDLYQQRLTVGGAFRTSDRWQGGFQIPYVYNSNTYDSGLSRQTHGIGDTNLGIWYEAFDNIQCVWEVNSLEDLRPATYFGLTAQIPTGISPYDDVEDNFDITGTGFYRLTGSARVEKTVFPITVSTTFNYGAAIERSINSEYGQYVDPYRKKQGDKKSLGLNLAYTHFTEKMHNLTLTWGFTSLQQYLGTIDGALDPTSSFKKRSISTNLSWSKNTKDITVRLSVDRAIKGDGWGKKFPTTEVLSLGVSYVFY